MTDRPLYCIQCGKQVQPVQLDDVYRDGDLVPLHKRGCPRPQRQRPKPQVP